MIWIIFTILCVYQALDMVQTYMLISIGVGEGNPVARFIIDRMGYWQGIIALKGSSMILVGFIIRKYEKLKGEQNEF